MNLKKLITLTAMTVMTGNVWGQTDNVNLLQGWDGTGCTKENPTPFDFGWTSSQSVNWGTLNATSGERFVTTYNYSTWDGSENTYREDPELSTKLLYLHFNSVGQTYTYTFKGLTPGHAYRFTGLSAWHANDDKNKGKCNVSIASANKTYISIYTEAQTTQKFYPMQATFIVPATETAEEFKMVIGNGNSTSMLSLSGIGLYDLGEVSYPTYNTATNLDFSLGALEDGVCTYIRDYNGDTKKKAQMQPVDGWYFTGRTGDCTAGGVMAYGSDKWVGGDTNKVPSTNPNGVESGNALAVVAVWGGSVNYIRPVTLPAGTYSLSIPVYNQAGEKALSKNLIGFVDMEGNGHYATTTQYTAGEWKTEIINLEFAEETKGYLSIGYTATNSKNAEVQHLFVDGITIQRISELDKAKSDLKSLIDGITIPTANIGVTFGYTDEAITTIKSALNNAKNVYENSTDLEIVKNAINTLTNAKEGLNAENAYVQAEADQHFAFVLTYNGWDFDNKAVTYIPNGRTDMGLYSIEYKSEVNANDLQAFTMTKVEGGYKMSQIDADGKERFICTSSKWSDKGNAIQIRTTTESDKALVVKVIPTDTDGKFNLWNTEANQYLGSQDKGLYTVNSHIDFNIVELAQATLKVVSGVQYGTFIAPFAANAPEDVKLYSVDEVDGTTLKLTEQATIAANTPYIVYSDTESTISKTYYSKSTATEDAYQAGLLVGTLPGGVMTLGTDCYLLQKNNDVVGFYQCVADQKYTLGANRAYLKYEPTAPVKAFFFGEENQTTAITTLSELMNGKAEIYDLNGRKLRKLEKGINIVNGKKVIIK